MKSELRADCLNVWEVLAQSIAMIGPTITPVLIIPLMYAQTGDAGCLAYVFGAVTIAAVALNLNVFARRSASSGSLYIFAQRAFGGSGALLVGWCLLWAYAFVALAGTMAFTVFFVSLTASVKEALPPEVGAVLCVAIAWFLSYRDVRVSTIALLVLEAISLTLITILIVLIFVHHHGNLIDGAQWALHGATWSSLALGAVLAIFSLLGFESATSLGEEAKDPLRTIPRAVMASVVIAGLFFVIAMYAEVLGLRGAATPLDKLATAARRALGQRGRPLHENSDRHWCRALFAFDHHRGAQRIGAGAPHDGSKSTLADGVRADAPDLRDTIRCAGNDLDHPRGRWDRCAGVGPRAR
jgi:amino acid transporter